VEILAELRMDQDSLVAALLFPVFEANLLSLPTIEDQVNPAVSGLLTSVQQMAAIRTIPLSVRQNNDGQQADTLRRMLLAMVEDVRAVVIKLAAQICTLREVKNAD